MKLELTPDQLKAVTTQQGLIEVQAGNGHYVLISMEMYRDLLGIGTDAELAESLKAIEEGLADIDAGRTRPFREVLDELGREK
jgi:hypothetical protein